MDDKNIIGFYRVRDEYGYMSNWYPSTFAIGGITFSSSEQYMMYMKAITFKDYDTANKIMSTNDVSRIKSLGRQVSNYNEIVWNGIRATVVYEGLLEKFSQNKELMDKLLSTGDSILCECSPTDCVWGIGLSVDNPDVYDISKWRGQNLLGFILCLVRDKLRGEFYC